MQLQQNLFSLSRLFLKVPKPILAVISLCLLLTASYFLIKLHDPRLLPDSSLCLKQYAQARNELRQEQKATDNVTQQDNNNNGPLLFLDDQTLLNIQVVQADQCSYQINTNYTYGIDKLPLMTMASNQQLLYLKNSGKDYLNRHGIQYDRLFVPSWQIYPPFFSFLFNQEMERNQEMFQSLRRSFITFTNLNMIQLSLGVTNSSLLVEQLHINYYLTQNQDKFGFNFDFYRYVSTKTLPSFLLKVVFCFSMAFVLLIAGAFMGLLVRYLIILFHSIFLAVCDRCLRQNWGWMHVYLLLLYRRLRVNRWSSIRMLLCYIFSNVGMNALLSFGAYCILRKIMDPFIPLLTDQYRHFFFATLFVVELFHYLFCRSRTALRFFPLFSFFVSYTVMILLALKNFGTTQILLNINITLQLFLMVSVMVLQQSITNESKEGLIGEYCPSLNKPRMLFYAGYDISWEKSLPPIWTYFTSWFDYSHFNQAQKSLLQKDYQLLYGRMLGLNERQQIPDEQEQEEIQGLHDQPSNQMNLIH